MAKLQARLLGSIGLLLALAAFPGAAAAQDYPSRQIRLIIPFPPGGSNDVVGRIIANQLGQKLGKPVFVDNRGGAGGVVGSDVAAKAAPDGYTLLVVSIAHAVNPWLYKLPFDPTKDFVPVSILATGTNVLTVNPNVPVHSVRELIDLAKQKPGDLNYASAGIGSFQHLSGELFKLMAGVDIVHVPYKGGGPSMLAVIAGEDQVMFSSIVQTVPSIQSDQLRALATGGAQPDPARSADHRRGRRSGLRGDQLVGHRRARRHAATGRRQAARRNRRPPQFGDDQKISRQRRRGARAHELGRVRQFHRFGNRQMGAGGQEGRHEGGVSYYETCRSHR
jgi:tripartite-type tricarboxylate transporter receptor subunit TctC